jgi:hypothetical protein
MEGQRCLHFWPIPRMVVLPPPVPQRKVYLVDILVEHEPKEPWAKTYINGDWKPDEE